VWGTNDCSEKKATFTTMGVARNRSDAENPVYLIDVRIGRLNAGQSSSRSASLIAWGCPPSVGPPETGRTRDEFATLPSPVPRDRGGRSMSEVSKTVRTHPVALLFAAIGVGLVVYLGITLSNPLVWGALALIAAVTTFLYVRGRRIDAARERAWEGSFSFGDVVARRRAEASAVTGVDG
jgi:hypothetical protein